MYHCKQELFFFCSVWLIKKIKLNKNTFVLFICKNVEKICMFLSTIRSSISIFKQESGIKYPTIEEYGAKTILFPISDRFIAKIIKLYDKIAQNKAS